MDDLMADLSNEDVVKDQACPWCGAPIPINTRTDADGIRWVSAEHTCKNGQGSYRFDRSLDPIDISGEADPGWLDRFREAP